MTLEIKKMHSCQSGFTLIEIMVALGIGLFLLSGIFQIFISTKQSYLINNALSRMQENGRFAMDFIARDIRMADYRGCPTDRTVSMYKMTGGTVATIVGSAAVYGTEGVSGAPDTLSLAWMLQACGAAITKDARTYSIDKTVNPPVLKQNTPQLIEGVENMQVLYGINTDTDSVDPARAPNYYTTAPAASSADWDKVTSIRVSLLIRSLENNMTSNPVAYKFNGNTVTPTDRYLRREFTSTFAVRNRLPT